MHTTRYWQTRRHPLRLGAWRRRQRSAPGQALIELALSFTFLAFLFAAAVDLGMAYKAYQTLLNASAEASTYLMLNPVVNCNVQTCPNSSGSIPDEIEGADREARVRFRTEQGPTLRGSSSTLDLDANGRDDLVVDGRAWSWLDARIQIDEADSSQVTIVNSNFAVGSNFDPAATNNACQQRQKYYTVGTTTGLQCFIVVRAQIDYRPFAIAPAIGDVMTIRAISVHPITQNTQ